jgi:hypothetical protein
VFISVSWSVAAQPVDDFVWGLEVVLTVLLATLAGSVAWNRTHKSFDFVQKQESSRTVHPEFCLYGSWQVMDCGTSLVPLLMKSQEKIVDIDQEIAFIVHSMLLCRACSRQSCYLGPM